MFYPTDEQVKINELVKTGANVVVQAGAGAAKSTTLRYLAQQNPNKHFLVLCFNSVNASESNEHPEKPKNMTYRTFHSIAYSKIGYNYRTKVKTYLNYRDIDDSVIDSLAYLTKIDNTKQKNEIKYAVKKAILNCVTAYCRSTYKAIDEFALAQYTTFFSKDSKEVLPDASISWTYFFSTEDIELLVKETYRYWQALISSDPKVQITHDVYLKLYHLHGYKLQYVEPERNSQEISVDVLCLDEAQDSNELQIAIFNNSSIRQKIVVGDKHQQLYAWRGAINAMDKFPDYKTATLSVSFRFNKYIAECANSVLDYADADFKIVGSNTKYESIKSIAFLTRTNAEVLLVIWVAFKNHLKIYPQIDTKDLFSKLYHINAVYYDEVPKFPNATLSAIRTKADLFEAMAISPEIALLNKLGFVVRKLGGTLHKGIEMLKTCIVDDPSLTGLTVSTIHKAKGLEWDKVIIGDDLVGFSNDPEELQAFFNDSEFINILYVAITRAKISVNLPKSLESRLDVGYENSYVTFEDLPLRTQVNLERNALFN